MQVKAKITFVLPDSLQKDFREQIIKDGYDMRGKSKWVSEGIVSLLGMRNYPELVYLGNGMKGFEKNGVCGDYKRPQKVFRQCRYRSEEGIPCS